MARILLVDDNESYRGILKSVLETAKHEVIVAHNGDAGLNLFLQEDPTLIITDILMPECDGIEFLQSLKAINHKVPIICISGGIEGDTSWMHSLTKTFGALHLLRKPFGNQELLKLLEKLIPNEESAAEPRKPRVLVVEDERSVREILEQKLQLAGYEVFKAGDGVEGLIATNEHKPDIIITDILMKHADGLNFIDRVRTDFPDTPIIAISGVFAHIPDLSDTLKSKQVFKCIHKPFSLNEIVDTVEKALQ